MNLAADSPAPRCRRPSPLRRGLGAPLLLVALLAATLAPPAAAESADDEAAAALVKKSQCLKCHSVEKRKSAPSYREIAAKYKGREDAEAVLARHLTGGTKVKVEGADEEHASLNVADEGERRKVVRWILTR